MGGMRILMAGASGFLGTRLGDRLAEAGHEITRLVRRPPRGAGESSWQPSQGQIDPAVVAGADVVINMAGANIGTHRWTKHYRGVLRKSRVDTTATLANAIRQLPAADRPGTMVQASGISA